MWDKQYINSGSELKHALQDIREHCMHYNRAACFSEKWPASGVEFVAGSGLDYTYIKIK